MSTLLTGATATAIQTTDDSCPLFQDPLARAGVGPSAIAAADVDGDGLMDLAVTNAPDATVSILLGNGDGTFRTDQTLPVAANPKDVVLVDMNGDAAPDLVIAEQSGQRVKVLLNTGRGGFVALAPSTSVQIPREVLAADFDGDGDMDVAVTTSFKWAFLRNNGAGILSVAASHDVDSTVARLVAGDFDDDGDFDVACSAVVSLEGQDTAAVVVFLNNGAGEFEPQAAIPSEGTISSLALVDADSDGDLDVVAARVSSGTVSVMLNDGAGTLALPAPLFTTSTGSKVMLAVDVDGQGPLDFVLAAFEGGTPAASTVAVALDGGDGGAPAASYQVGPKPADLVAADVDGDGDHDLVVSDSDDDGVYVLINRGAADFSMSAMTIQSPSPIWTLEGDVDGDGDRDIVTRALNGASLGDVIALVNDGAGSLSPVSSDALPNPTAAAVGDLDGDGDDDLVTSESISLNLVLMKSNGDGTFSQASTFDTPGTPVDLELADFDGDGDLDVAAACTFPKSLVVALNDSTGALTTSFTHLFVQPGLLRIAAGDGDGDGDVDLVVLNENQVSLFRNHGDGTFNPELWAILTMVKDIAMADLDDDADAEIVMALPRLILVASFDVEDGLWTTLGYEVPGTPTQVAIANVDLDGTPDIVLGYATSAMFTVMRADGASYVPASYRLPAKATRITLSDLDGDGRSNVVAEYTALSFLSLHTQRPPCDPTGCPDLDGDSMIDGADLALLLSAWGDCATCPEDLNQDGQVEGGDLAALLAGWGACTGVATSRR